MSVSTPVPVSMPVSSVSSVMSSVVASVVASVVMSEAAVMTVVAAREGLTNHSSDHAGYKT
jgi:putative effector of murein hydrolase LrgA (UPF0299 family)